MNAHGFRRLRISRRSLLRQSALAAGALALPLAPCRIAHAAGQLRPVSMILDWVYEGPNLGFLVAHDQGFYRDAGLDVTIAAGKGSGKGSDWTRPELAWRVKDAASH